MKKVSKGKRKSKGYRQMFQKNVLILFCLTLLLSPFGTALGFNVEQVQAEDVTEIMDIEELNDIRQNLDGNYILGDDIDLSDVTDWEPIGTEDNPFNGAFDGNDFKITGMNESFSDDEYKGLFGDISDDANLVSLKVEFKEETITDDPVDEADENEASDPGTDDPVDETHENDVSDADTEDPVDEADENGDSEASEDEDNYTIKSKKGMVFAPLGNGGPFAGGTGTEGDPYEIETPEQLDEVRNHLTDHFILTSHIDLDVNPYNQGDGWEPIGSPFTGKFNGNGQTISNLMINRSTENYVGLFGRVSGDITNVTLTNVSIKGKKYVGGLVGQLSLDSSITDSHSSGNVEGTGDNVGGLVGYHDGDIEGSTATGQVNGVGYLGGLVGRSTSISLILDSDSSGNVEGTGDNVGGLVGYHDGDIEGSTATGQVNGVGYVGGLVGSSGIDSLIIDSHSAGDVEGSGHNVGGLVGSHSGAISGSLATGQVNGVEDVGGLVGSAQQGSITESYATGNVFGKVTGGLIGRQFSSSEIIDTYATGTVNSEEYAGSLIGRDQGGKIQNSYAIGHVTTTGNPSRASGLIGIIDTTNTIIINSFYDSNTTGHSDDDGKGTPKTTVEMKQQVTFAGWDFAGVWDMPANDYPRLKWEGIGSQSPVAGGDVTAVHVDEAGDEIANEVVHSGNVGETYTTEEKDITGYTFKEIIGEDEGTFTADAQEVKYVYTKEENSTNPKDSTKDPKEPKDSKVPGSKDPKTPGGKNLIVEKDSEDDLVVTIEGESGGDSKDELKESTKNLPKTATPYYTILFAGLLLVLIGGVIYLITRKKWLTKD